MLNIKKSVTVIGGGYYGSAVAKHLDSNKNIIVTLIDQREKMLHKMGSLRASVASGVWAERATVPYHKLFKNENNKIIQKNVSKVEENLIKFEDGTIKESSYIVLATGAVNKSPGEVPIKYKSYNEMINYFSKTAKLIGKSKKIVIVGGGTVAAELAAEIKTVYGSKKDVTIITNGNTLLANQLPPLPKQYLSNLLSIVQKDLSINVILNEKVLEPKLTSNDEGGMKFGNTIVKTSNGTEIEADAVIFCIGVEHENTKMYPSEWLDSNYNNLIKVDQNLLVEGTKSVFAVGDCTNIREGKGAAMARFQVPVCSSNIINLVNGKSMNKIYKANQIPFTVLPLGNKFGYSYIPNINVGSTLTGLVKGYGLFGRKTWGELNLKPPSYTSNWESNINFDIENNI